MENALQALLSWQFVLFCVSVAACTHVIRIVVDFILRSKNIEPKNNLFWTDLVLPILPVILGSAGAVLAKQYPYPLDIGSGSGRFAFGLCAGLLSGLVWRVVKSMIHVKLVSQTVNPAIAPDVGEGAAAEKSKEVL
jgi:hypothetical protein